ncbi:hypothetical protein HY468_00135 [Candidatus Roizmanbacteria bacterium]|nr:hypothetical protein [Candidatus Roizmanbacteria bacterium]
MKTVSPGVGIPIIIITVYIVTTHPFLKLFQYQLLYTMLFALIFFAFFAQRTHRMRSVMPAFAMLLSAFLLLLVGTTGWFQSPFAFGMYLLIVVLSFLFPPAVSLSLVSTLFLIVLLRLGNDDPTTSFLTILSLLTIIPVSFFLREKYLAFQEAERAILILRKGKRIHNNVLDDILGNEVVRFATQLREPLNRIKQYVHQLDPTDLPARTEKKRQQIITTTEQSLALLKEFEEEVTGGTLLSTPENNESGLPAGKAKARSLSDMF